MKEGTTACGIPAGYVFDKDLQVYIPEDGSELELDWASQVGLSISAKHSLQHGVLEDEHPKNVTWPAQNWRNK